MHCGELSASAPLAVQLVFLGHRVALLIDRRLARLGYNTTQVAILMVLARHGELRPQSLAGPVPVEPPSITRALQALERRRLVCRKPHPTDGRASLFSLTPLGEEAVTAIDRLARDVSAEIERGLSPEDREAIRRILPSMSLETEQIRGSSVWAH